VPDLFAALDRPPAVRGSATSQAAADSIAPLTGRLLLQVLAAFEAAGEAGLTDEEGMERTKLGGSTYRPRRVSLVEAGKVRDSGKTRPTLSGRRASVWIKTDLYPR
jgi:hypothetical protein